MDRGDKGDHQQLQLAAHREPLEEVGASADRQKEGRSPDRAAAAGHRKPGVCRWPEQKDPYQPVLQSAELLQMAAAEQAVHLVPGIAPCAQSRPQQGKEDPAAGIPEGIVDTTLWRGKRVQDPYINAYRFSAVTGLRPGELIGLRWADVHGDQVCIRRAINVHGEETRGKNENALRAFTLTGTAAAILADQRLLTGAEDSVFDIQSESTYRHCWKRYCEANDIDYIPPYNLRHTFVSLAKTLPEGAVKPLVGHSRQMDTYGVYAHLLQGEEEQTALELENKLQKVLCNRPVL